jgi:phage repressor protein C with HTH and peptisase S24 domain
MSDETIADRVKKHVPGRKKSESARKCGIPPKTFASYLEGVEPSATNLAKIAKGLGLGLEWLITGEGPELQEDSGSPAAGGASQGGMLMIPQAGATEGFALVPRLDIQASAGNGRVALNEEPLEYLAFQAAWLRGRGINPASARILTARGDSMEETIRDGDVLLVDTSIDRVRDNSIYVVVLGDMVLVKRVHGRINGSLQLISDNPRYPAEEVPKGEVDQLHIAGRVAWYGRSI